jgi:hypothetical protein
MNCAGVYARYFADILEAQFSCFHGLDVARLESGGLAFEDLQLCLAINGILSSNKSDC